jgi:uncharacterized membrane protein YeaQ/YmgE (transglycosylase-associated protein family)
VRTVQLNLNVERAKMSMSGESLLIILLVGLIAGWLAGHFVQGTGFGFIGDLVIGIVGALIGGWLLPQLGIHLGLGLVAAIINATIGAVLLLLVIRLVRGGGWSSGWGEVGGDAGSRCLASSASAARPHLDLPANRTASRSTMSRAFPTDALR